METKQTLSTQLQNQTKLFWIAKRQRQLFWLLLTRTILFLLATCLPYLFVFAPIVFIFSIYYAWTSCNAFSKSKFIYVMSQFIPFVGWIALIFLNSKMRSFIISQGYQLGIVGLPNEEIEKLFH